MYIQLENEKRNDLEGLKKILQEKDPTIQSLLADVDEIKYQLEDMVTRIEFVNVERDVIDVQQYSRRNNVEISGLPEEITDLKNTAINIGSAVGVHIYIVYEY